MKAVACGKAVRENLIHYGVFRPGRDIVNFLPPHIRKLEEGIPVFRKIAADSPLIIVVFAAGNGSIPTRRHPCPALLQLKIIKDTAEARLQSNLVIIMIKPLTNLFHFNSMTDCRLSPVKAVSINHRNRF